jgi:LysM repeat protein
MPRFLSSSHAQPDGNSDGEKPRERAGRQPLLEFPNRARRDSHADRLLRAQQARSRRPQAQPLGRGQGAASRSFERRRIGGRHGGSGPGGWLQRHPLGVAYASVLIAVLSLAFAALQVMHRPDTSAASQSVGAEDQTLAASAIPGGSGAPGAAGAASAGASGLVPASLQVQRTVKVLEPTYTIQAGDTLNRIAARFDTTVERIQAWNDLPDPRALRVGAKLVIPPPLPTSPE